MNVTGSLIIGFIATLTAPEGRWLVAPSARQFVMIGVCGGYTTLSSFSLPTLNLARNGEWFRAGANAALSIVLCMVAVRLWHLLAASLNSTGACIIEGAMELTAQPINQQALCD